MARIEQTGDAGETRKVHRPFRVPTDLRMPWHPAGRWYEPGEKRVCHKCGSVFGPEERSVSSNYCATCIPNHYEEDE